MNSPVLVEDGFHARTHVESPGARTAAKSRRYAAASSRKSLPAAASELRIPLECADMSAL